jgi:hypothetical protein
MKALLILGICFASSFAFATTFNPAAKQKAKRVIASGSQADDDMKCQKQAEEFARANYATVLGGADKVKEVVWLSGGHTVLKGNKGQDKTKLTYEIAVTSSSFKSQGENDVFDYGAMITLTAKDCHPTTMRFYSARNYENVDTFHE